MKVSRTGSRKIQMFSEKSFRSGTTAPVGKLRGTLRHSNTKPQLKPKKFEAGKAKAVSKRKMSPSPQLALASEV